MNLQGMNQGSFSQMKNPFLLIDSHPKGTLQTKDNFSIVIYMRRADGTLINPIPIHPKFRI